MAPALLLAFALFATTPEDDAVATAAPAVATTPRASAQEEPASDYELVAWCYGALGAHMGLYDIAMPEVERIERRFESSPGSAEGDIASYKTQHEEGKKQLALFRRAMEGAEKASIKPIQTLGVAAIRKGEATWTGSQMADPKFLAREWMSWGLPERCTTTAEKLAADSALLGQAISYNVQPAAPAAEPAAESEAEPAAEPVADAAPAEEQAAPEADQTAAAEEQPAAEAEEAAPAEEQPAAADEPSALDAILESQDGAEGP